MPNKVTVYDKGAPETRAIAATATEAMVPAAKAVPAHEIEMYEIDAKEAIARDPGRYSLKPWKSLVVSDRDKAKAAEAAKAAKSPLFTKSVDDTMGPAVDAGG